MHSLLDAHITIMETFLCYKYHPCFLACHYFCYLYVSLPTLIPRCTSHRKRWKKTTTVTWWSIHNILQTFSWWNWSCENILLGFSFTVCTVTVFCCFNRSNKCMTSSAGDLLHYEVIKSSHFFKLEKIGEWLFSHSKFSMTTISTSVKFSMFCYYCSVRFTTGYILNMNVSQRRHLFRSMAL